MNRHNYFRIFVNMKKTKKVPKAHNNSLRYLFVFFLCQLFIPLHGKDYGSISIDSSAILRLSADTLLERVFRTVENHLNEVNEYRADCYIKGHFTIHKKNWILKYIPSLYSFDKHINHYLYESFSRIHYTAPNIYDRKVVAVTSTFRNANGQLFDIMDYLKLNLYSTTVMENKILSPFARHSQLYYDYLIDKQVYYVVGEPCYQIRVVPRLQSTQLIGGLFYIRLIDFGIARMQIEGKYDLIHFDLDMTMGDNELTRYLPVRFKLDLNFRFLKNHLEMAYTGRLRYDKVITQKPDMQPERHNYNLTNSYSLSSDTTRITDRKVFFDTYRPIPLTEEEQQIYERARRNDKVTVVDPDSVLAVQSKRKSQMFWGQVGDVLVNRYAINIKTLGSLDFSGLLNPILFSYSPSGGLSYQQMVKFNKVFADGSHLRIVPRLGYNFSRKEWYASGLLEFFHSPHRQGKFTFEIGNENRIYSDLVMKQMEAHGDTIKTDNAHPYDYFKEVYLNISNQVEIINGLNLHFGISYHRRYLTKRPRAPYWIQTDYYSFAPRLRLTWTPGMYYYMSGGRKINTYSHYPTVMLDYERGIRLFKKYGEYERIECSMEQSITFRNLNVLAYHIGVGAFTYLKDSYFVAFADFSTRYLPVGWNDDIGGSFQMLSGRWYNEGRHYLRGNLTFESPFILLYPVSKLLSFIQRERIYAGVLVMPGLHPYIEVGYGFGTHLFDTGVFVGNENGRFTGIGCKFTFELFNK